MLFAGSSVAAGELTLFGVVAAGRARQPGRLLDRLRGRLLRPHRPAGKKQADPHQPQAPEMGRRLVRRATATRSSSSRGCCRSSAPSSRCRPASRKCRSGASPLLTLLGCIPWVLMLALIGKSVGDNWEEWRDHLALPRLRGGRAAIVARSSTCWSSAGAAAAATRTRPPPTRRSPPAAAALERAAAARCRPRRALALGIVQGPAELLPVSSSAHIVLVPWLAGWDWEADRPGAAQELRGGAAHRRRGGAADRPAAGDRRRAARSSTGAGRCCPRPLLPAGGGRRLHAASARSSERLGGPRATAYGLLAGAAAMLARRHPAAAARPRRRHPGRRPRARRRPGGGAGAGGLPQRLTLAAARWRALLAATRRTCSRARSRCRSSSAPPALKGARLARRGTTPELRRSLALGVGASFASTLASQRLIGLVERDRALWPYAAYRAALAAAVLAQAAALTATPNFGETWS